MKKLLSTMLVTCICISFCFPVYAAEPIKEDLISISEYEAVIKAEGAKYDVECNVLSYDSDIQITKEMLDYAVNNVRTYAMSIEDSTEKVEIESTTQIDDKSGDINPLSMPVTKNVYGLFTVENAYGSADMRVNANVTVNVQNSNVISVNSTNAYQSGLFINFVSWETTSISSLRNNPSNGWIRLTVNGRATFAYADPWTGITTGYTSNVSKAVTINCD